MPTSSDRLLLAIDDPQFIAHRARFARLRYIVWGCSGYNGGNDIDEALVRPVGFSDREEAHHCAAAMIAACEAQCDSQAEIINGEAVSDDDSDDDSDGNSNDSSDSGYEWNGSQSYYVATLTLPKALNWDGVHAFAAMKADVLQQGIEDVEEWIAEACELEVDAGGYDDDGSPYVGDNYDAARDYIPSALE